ncbi:hypothetical protein R1sor_014920 [Riccia sorocarpa]|uniref:Uncharacterized protein n=1 Tax=Riccia sorocarpa TaxID=122646 RepID=A0ABD3HCM0_9MARC
MGLIGYKEGETLLSLRNKLESTQYFSSSFQFWDSRLSSPVHIKLEGLIFIENLEGKVVVFETKDLKVGLEPLSGKGVAEKAVVDYKKEVALLDDAPFEYTEPEEVAVNSSVASSEPSVAGDDRLEGKALFLSKKMLAVAEAAWRDQVEKLIRWQQKVNKGDHAWRVKTWDAGDNALGTFECLECHCQLAEKTDNNKLRAKVSDLQYHVNMLNEHVNKAKQTTADHESSLKGANQTRQQIASLQDEVSRFKEQQGKWLSDKVTLQKMIESLRADKHEAVQAKETAEVELRAAMAAAEGYKKSMDSELDTAAAAQLEKDRLNDEVSTLKFSLERAEKNTLLAHQELASVRVQLRRFQIHEGSNSAREKSNSTVILYTNSRS